MKYQDLPGLEAGGETHSHSQQQGLHSFLEGVLLGAVGCKGTCVRDRELIQCIEPPWVFLKLGPSEGDPRLLSAIMIRLLWICVRGTGARGSPPTQTRAVTG